MRKLVADEFMTMFCNGCCGNINHIDYSDKTQGRGYQMAQRVGYMLAVAAYEAIRSQTSVASDELGVSSELVALKRLQISDTQQLWSQDVLEKARNTPVRGQIDGLPDEHYAQVWMDMYQKQSEDDHVEVMVFRIGDVGIVGLPGEIFCELGLEIKRHSPAAHTLVVELANDAIGYMPTEQAFSQGGYEPTPGSTMYERGSGERLVKSALKQLNELFEEQT